MKSSSKLLALLLALVLVAALFAGCTNNGGSTEATPTPAASTGSTGNTNTGSTETTTEPTEEPYEFKLPLVDTPTTLTAWRGWTNEGLTIGDPAEIACNVWLAEKTGITIQWEADSGATATEQFGLMIASNDYCDMICASSNTYVGGVDKGIADEVYVDVSPYESIMPNYWAARKLTEGISSKPATSTMSPPMAAGTCPRPPLPPKRLPNMPATSPILTPMWRSSPSPSLRAM